MTTIKQQIGLAVAAALAISPAMAGCAPVASDEEVAASIEQAVNAGVPTVTGSFAKLGYSGVERTVWVRVYVDSDSPEELASILDQTLEAAWDASPIQPERITVDARMGMRPGDVELTPEGAIDLRPAARLLGLGDRASDALVVGSDTLVERYGEQDSRDSDD